jgi:hypothetical protein
VSAHEWNQKFNALPDREKQIWRLASKATNALGFALQNTHSDRIVMKYEEQSDAAMHELFELLRATSGQLDAGGGETK